MRSLRGLLTTRGRAFVGAGLTLLARIIFGFQDLTRFGVLLVALPTSAPSSCAPRMRIERHISPDRITVGQDAPSAFENVSTTTTPVFLAEERLDYVLGDRPRFIVGRIPPGRGSGSSTTPSGRTCAGAITSGACRAGPGPFGLATRNAVWRGRRTSSSCPRSTRCPPAGSRAPAWGPASSPTSSPCTARTT